MAIEILQGFRKSLNLRIPVRRHYLQLDHQEVILVLPRIMQRGPDNNSIIDWLVERWVQLVVMKESTQEDIVLLIRCLHPWLAAVVLLSILPYLNLIIGNEEILYSLH